MKLIICRGCPASGKTTWAKDYIKNVNKNIVRINRDDIRRQFYPSKNFPYYVMGNKTEEGVQRIVENMMSDASVGKVDVIDDNTNLNIKYFDKNVKSAEKLGFTVEVKDFFDVPLDKLLTRNLEREHSVPEDVIHRMFRAQLHIQNRVIVSDPSKQSCIVVDIDGTVAEMGKGEPWGRGSFEWHKVLNDKPRENVINTVLDLSNRHHIYFLSGRDGVAYEDTALWLLKNIISRGSFPCGYSLKLRTANDNRPDSIVKEELLHAHVLPNYNIAFCIDDRDSVVHHYRALGLEVWQVAQGRF
jgi:predicted kinase